MRAVHRAMAFFAGIFLLYMAITGITIQSIDISTLLRHAPANDPNLQSMREGINGPPNFQVISDSDYTAELLPASFAFPEALSTVLRAVRQADPTASLNFLEFRMQAGQPVALVKSSVGDWRFDAISGAALADKTSKATPVPLGPIKSDHNTFKNLHRMTAYGQWVTPLVILIGLCLCTFLFTGILLYARLYAARNRLRRQRVFWLAGGWWRSLHRAVAVIASVWILVIAITGTWLAIETVEIATYVLIHGQRTGLRVDASSPLKYALLGAELDTTLKSQAAAMPGVPIKVLRLRNFAGMPQGVVISGNSATDTRQRVFNSATGRETSESEAGYPATGYQTGWHLHEVMKKIHRGDYFGVAGRWVDLITGLSVIFLSVSGAVMYLNMWNLRRRVGRRSPYWI